MKTFLTFTFLALILLSTLTTVNAQPDSISSIFMGGDRYDKFEKVIRTRDGGYGFIGIFRSEIENSSPAFLGKLNSEQDSLWTVQTIGSQFTAKWLKDIVEVDDSMLIEMGVIAPQHISAGLFITGYSAQGDSLWGKVYFDTSRGMLGSTIIKGNENTLYIFGGNVDGGFMFTMSLNGDSLNFTQLDGVPSISNAKLTSDGGMILFGDRVTNQQPEWYDLFLAKLTSEHEVEWYQEYGNESRQMPVKVVQTEDGGYLIGSAFVDSNDYTRDIQLRKLTNDGELIWSSIYGRDDYGFIGDFYELQDGTILISGSQSNIQSGQSDGWLAQIDTEGEIIWECNFGRGEENHLGSICATGENSFAIAGWTTSARGDTDAWILNIALPLETYFGDFILHPSAFSLSSFPSPFNSSTVVSFSSPFSGEVRVALVDLSGRRIKEWIPAFTGMTDHRFAVDGAGLSAGTYWLKVEQGGRVASTRLVLVK